jgi:glycosyltransferase involved in cell wall biosynthesis
VRIGLIAPPWVTVPPLAYGGTEVVLDTLARGLVADGHEVLLYTTGDSTCPVPRASTLPRAVGTQSATPATELCNVVNAYDAVLAWGPDVIHDHTLFGPLYGSRFRVPVVTTNHGPFQGELGDCYRAISRQVPTIAISHHHASTAALGQVYAVIPHGLDLQQFPVGRGGDYAVFLGRMSPDKGVHIAIEIARAAGVPLKIAAKLREPREYDYFNTMVQPLLGGGIEYVGEVGGTAKYELLGGARCLLNPIQWPEPFGLVMVESLACGTPVVATPFGSVPEIVEDGVTGFIREYELDLADAVLRAPELSRARCRESVEEKFSMERMVADHVAVYREVVAQPSSRRFANATTVETVETVALVAITSSRSMNNLATIPPAA